MLYVHPLMVSNSFYVLFCAFFYENTQFFRHPMVAILILKNAYSKPPMILETLSESRLWKEVNFDEFSPASNEAWTLH
jgi:hypothetical protein